MKQPFTLALPIIETPQHALDYGAGPRLAIIWKQPVSPVRGDFGFYDCLAMDEKGRHFKVRLDRASVEKAVREPRYFIEAEGIRGPTLGIVGHGELVKQSGRG